jgi:hypothetical protein
MVRHPSGPSGRSLGKVPVPPASLPCLQLERQLELSSVQGFAKKDKPLIPVNGCQRMGELHVLVAIAFH